MTMVPRRIRPDRFAHVRVETFEPRDDAAAMERICQIADWHRQGTIHRDPADALASVFYEVCASARYGEPGPPPVPLSAEAMDAINRRYFAEAMKPRAFGPTVYADITAAKVRP